MLTNVSKRRRGTETATILIVVTVVTYDERLLQYRPRNATANVCLFPSCYGNDKKAPRLYRRCVERTNSDATPGQAVQAIVKTDFEQERH